MEEKQSSKSCLQGPRLYVAAAIERQHDVAKLLWRCVLCGAQAQSHLDSHRHLIHRDPLLLQCFSHHLGVDLGIVSCNAKAKAVVTLTLTRTMNDI